MVVRIESAVKRENREKTIEAVCREETDLKYKSMVPDAYG